VVDQDGAPRRSAPPVISVIIPVLDGAKTLPAQLEALAGQVLGAPWEVIVADNGSTDGTPDLVRGWEDRLPGLRVLDASHVPGANGARNAGVRAAEGRLIALCDSDDVVAPGWLAAMVEGTDDFDVVSGRVIPWTGDGLPHAIGPSDQPAELTMGLGFLPFVWTCTAAFRREVFDHIGGFDEAFVGGAEDVDFSWRAIHAGFTLGLAPGAAVHYRQPQRLRDLARKYFRYGRQAPALYRRFRSQGMPARGGWAMLKVWVWLLAHVPSLVSPFGRRRWVEVAAGQVGRLVGSVQCGVLYC
jgi:GT2 family glycosyltransferase